MKKLSLVLCFVFSVLIFASCKAEFSPLLQKDDLGYDLSACLDQEMQTVLDRLESAGIIVNLDAENSGDKIQTYHFKDTVYGLEYDVEAVFYTLRDNTEPRFALYTKTLQLDEWPEGKKATAIQNTFDAMIEKYGKAPTLTNDINIHDKDAILSMGNREIIAQWPKETDFSFRSMELQVEQDGSVLIRISDSSEEAIQSMFSKENE